MVIAQVGMVFCPSGVTTVRVDSAADREGVGLGIRQGGIRRDGRPEIEDAIARTQRDFGLREDLRRSAAGGSEGNCVAVGDNCNGCPGCLAGGKNDQDNQTQPPEFLHSCNSTRRSGKRLRIKKPGRADRVPLSISEPIM